MWTEGQVNVLHAGQSVQLDCEFYAETFNMFKNPVVWKKRQRQEVTEINIMGNILPPFLATARFVVSFNKNPPRYRMTLRIAGQSSAVANTCHVTAYIVGSDAMFFLKQNTSVPTTHSFFSVKTHSRHSARRSRRCPRRIRSRVTFPIILPTARVSNV